MLTLDAKPQPHPDVIATTLTNEETILLHLATQQYYTLNETGTRIWEGLGQNRSLAEIGQALEAQYDITLEDAYHYVIELVTGLATERLVQTA